MAQQKRNLTLDIMIKLNFKTALICLVTPLFASSLLAQTVSIKEKEEKKLTRNLRVILVGNRPMPSFEKHGDKYIEVAPNIKLIPPTAFAYTIPAHAPRSADNKPRKTEHSAWINELVKINNYIGPSSLQLSLKRPLVNAKSRGIPTQSDLAQIINPLVIIHPGSKAVNWNNPKSIVLDASAKKMPERSITLVNLSKIPLRLYVSNKGVVVQPNKHITLSIPRSKAEAFRYKVEASNGKKIVPISNSSYRISKKSRIIMLALPGVKSNKSSFALPKIRIISDSL